METDLIVLTENEQSKWKDVTGERYHFPNKYINLVKPDAIFVYYRGTRKKDGSVGKAEYFGYGRIGSILRDEDIKESQPKTQWKWFCDIDDDLTPSAVPLQS